MKLVSVRHRVSTPIENRVWSQIYNQVNNQGLEQATIDRVWVYVYLQVREQL